ncbi:dehydrogenase [Nitrincola sp. A-D6]|uniref:outer membrane protein assembly factor BamB n=1 Tax=Nitrincola sp. A-D6 TaxID=1545442 RepID=UPI00051FE05F|nr:outer membrane protein assembly factor BamB [Nitrincola sp. A-D6]KGK42207.1 dehydrogenase [Nitrincola sp. A-D6]
MNSVLKVAVIALIFGLLAGCGFWGGGEEVQPAPLVDFSAENSVSVKWSANVGSGPGQRFHQMMPSIDGDKVYAADSQGVVTAFDRHTGQRAWSINLKEAVVGGVGAGFGQVLLTTRAGEVVALNGNDGAELWRFRLASEVTAQVQINREIVVLQQISGRVTALDRMTGEHRWSFDAQVPALTLRGTGIPLLAADVTFTGMSNGRLVALDNRDGELIWDQRVSVDEGRSELERIADINGRPLIVDNMLFVVGYQGRLLAINPFNAQVQWAQNISSYRSPATGYGNIYIADAQDNVHAYDAASSASVWSQSALTNRLLTSPSVLGNTVVVGDQQGYLHFMSQVNGRFVARYRVDSSGLQGDMLVRDNVLYVLTNSGRLAAITLN